MMADRIKADRRQGEKTFSKTQVPSCMELKKGCCSYVVWSLNIEQSVHSGNRKLKAVQFLRTRGLAKFSYSKLTPLRFHRPMLLFKCVVWALVCRCVNQCSYKRRGGKASEMWRAEVITWQISSVSTALRHIERYIDIKQERKT